MRTFKIRKCKRIPFLSYSPDGRHLVIATSGAEDHIGSAEWLDVRTGEAVRTIPLDVERFALSPDHGKLAIAYSPYTRPGGAAPVRWAAVPTVGDEPTWTDVPNMPHQHVFSLGFTPDGKRLTIGCSSQRDRYRGWVHSIHIAPAGRGKSVTFAVDEAIGEIQLSPNGKWMIATGGPGGDPTIRFFPYPGEMPTRYIPKATRTRKVVFLPDRIVFAALAGKRAEVIMAGRTTPLDVLNGHTGQVNDAAFTPDGRTLFTASQDGSVRTWDMGPLGALEQFDWKVQALKSMDWKIGPVTAVAVAPDGLTAAVAGKSGQIVVWDLDD